MNTVEPIRDRLKIAAIKNNLRAGTSPRDFLLFVMGINTALRISDLLRLTVGDVLDEKGNIQDRVYIREQKTKRQVKIKLNESVIEALTYYFSKAPISDYEDPLFKSHKSNRPIERVRAWQLVQEWVQAVGLNGERFGTHTLRKTWGFQARKQGIPVELIMEKLGHKSPAVTRRYIGITDEEINNVEARVCL